MSFSFQVPQFIEVEDKIFGPLTFKQFLFLLGSGGLAFIFYILDVSWIIKGLPMIASIGFGLALAFYQVNDRPFVLTLQAAAKFLVKNKLYLWKKDPNKKPFASSNQESGPDIAGTKQLPQSRLKDLTWSLDIQERIK